MIDQPLIDHQAPDVGRHRRQYRSGRTLRERPGNTHAHFLIAPRATSKQASICELPRYIIAATLSAAAAA